MCVSWLVRSGDCGEKKKKTETQSRQMNIYKHMTGCIHVTNGLDMVQVARIQIENRFTTNAETLNAFANAEL